MHLTAKSGGSDAVSASPESILSPDTRKRQRSKCKQDGKVQQQYRKVRGKKAAKAIDGDIITVETE